ncbi:MAG: CvpA family protein [Clostridia bacterium]|nr:CvpA family protein [Clostridia bacterium]
MLNLLTSNGSAVINVVALVFVLGFALYGLIRGFAKTFISMFGTILGILLAILLCSSVASFLESKFSFVTSMASSLSGVVGNIFGGEAMDIPIAYATEETMQLAGVNGLLIKLVLSIKSNGTYSSDTTLGQVICPTFAYYIALIISAVALFIIFKLIFIVIGNIIKKSYNIRIVEKIDRTLGLVLGLISGVIYFETIVMLIGAIPIDAVQDLYVLIENSTIAHAICAINPYDSIFSLISFNNISSFVSSLL